MLHKRYLILSCLLLLLTACPPEKPCIDPPLVQLDILSGDSSLLKNYIYVHGMGKEGSRIYPRFPRASAYDSVKGQYYPYIDSGMGEIYLEMDMNSDRCSFCLVRTDLAKDTFTLSYKRNFYTHEYCDGFTFSNLAISGLSAAFNKDSSVVMMIRGGTWYVRLKQ